MLPHAQEAPQPSTMNLIDGFHVRIRVVDVGSGHDRVARKYMIRLEQRHLGDPERRAKLAATAHLTPAPWVKAFGAAVTAAEGWPP
jgi:hypothetical protein